MKFQKNAMSHLTTFLKILKCSAEKVCKISIKFCLSFKIRRKSVDIIRSNFVDQRVAVSRSDFRGAQMSGASLAGTYVGESIWTEADLSFANLHEANLTKVALTAANCCGANMYGVNLVLANVSGANFS